MFQFKYIPQIVNLTVEKSALNKNLFKLQLAILKGKKKKKLIGRYLKNAKHLKINIFYGGKHSSILTTSIKIQHYSGYKMENITTKS